MDGQAVAEHPRGGDLCVCGKIAYASKAESHAGVREHRDVGAPCKKCARGGRMHAYQCPVTGAWHAGHTFWRNGNGRTGRASKSRVKSGRRRR